MIDATRREFLQSSAVGSNIGGASAATAQSEASSFDIDKTFATFMRDLGGSAEDAGGRVLFTGRDPILQSPFRLGACMAHHRPASCPLRHRAWVRFLADYNIAAGTLPPGWLPPEWTWDPTVNGRNIQAPFLLGNPLGFQVFETKDGRLVTPTGIYPHRRGAGRASAGAGHRQHPGHRDHQDRRQRPYPLGQQPGGPALGHPRPLQQPRSPRACGPPTNAVWSSPRSRRPKRSVTSQAIRSTSRWPGIRGRRPQACCKRDPRLERYLRSTLLSQSPVIAPERWPIVRMWSPDGTAPLTASAMPGVPQAGICCPWDTFHTKETLVGAFAPHIRASREGLFLFPSSA